MDSGFFAQCLGRGKDIHCREGHLTLHNCRSPIRLKVRGQSVWWLQMVIFKIFLKVCEGAHVTQEHPNGLLGGVSNTSCINFTFRSLVPCIPYLSQIINKHISLVIGSVWYQRSHEVKNKPLVVQDKSLGAIMIGCCMGLIRSNLIKFC